MTTEAREAVAVLIAAEYSRNAYGVVECECCQEKLADAILSRLAELGYVQRDRLLSDEAVEAAMDAYVKSKTVEGFDGYIRAAIAAAIAKAGEV